MTTKVDPTSIKGDMNFKIFGIEDMVVKDFQEYDDQSAILFDLDTS